MKVALRSLLRTPGFALVAVLTLALGIGVNSALFSVIDAVILRPLPYAKSERLVNVDETIRGRTGSVSEWNLGDYRKDTTAFETLAGYSFVPLNVTGNGAPERVLAMRVEASWFVALRVAPVLGRAFAVNDARKGSRRVAILSYELWRRHFGSDSAVLGKTFFLNAEPAEIVGVMPAGFRAPRVTALADMPQLYIPITPTNLGRGDRELWAVGRLRDGATIEQAQQQIDAVSARLAKDYPDSNKDVRTRLSSLLDVQTAKYRLSLWVLLGAAVAILLIGCVNVANLLLVRAVARRHEMAVRASLGASRWRIIRDLLSESILLAVTGCAIGLLIGVWVRELLIVLAPADVPRLENADLDWRVVSFAAVLSLITAVVFGLAPAFRASSAKPQEALASASHRVTGGAVMGWKSALLVTEIALSLILLTGGALLLKSFIRLNATELGFSTDHVLAMQISLPDVKYSAQQRILFFEELAMRVRGLSGVKAAGYANQLPMRGGWGGGVQFPGEPETVYHEVDKQAVSPGYFEVLQLPLRRGRLLTSADREGTPPVAVVSETFAKQLLPDRDPIGARFRNGPTSPWIEIVGVVGDMRREGQASRVVPHVFQSALQISTYPVAIADFAFRTAGEPEALVDAIQQHVWVMDKDQPVARIRRMDDLVVEMNSTRRFQTTLVLLFAGLAVMLALIGVYGVVSYSVTQRSRELGIRAALGAQRSDILRMILRQSARLAILGVALGLAGALALSQYLESMLYQVKPNDVATYALAGASLLAVAVGASFLPARRAANADPMEALRYE